MLWAGPCALISLTHGCHPGGAQPENPGALGRAGEEVRSPGTGSWNSLRGSHGRNGIPAEKPRLSRLLVSARREEHRERVAEPCHRQGPPAQGRDTGGAAPGLLRDSVVWITCHKRLFPPASSLARVVLLAAQIMHTGVPTGETS